MSIFERIYLAVNMLPVRLEQRGHEKGAAMVEYALLVAGIAVVVGVAVAALGGRVVGRFNLILP